MNVVERFRDQAAEHGDSRSLTFLPEGADAVHLTFADLDRQARATAARLTAQGLTDQPVLLLYPAGLDFLVAFLGCLYARVLAIPAPLPTGPQHLPRVRSLIGDAGARLVLTDAANRSRLTALPLDIPVRTADRTAGPDADRDADPSGWASPELTPDTIAYLQYTSGSTAEPRGVQVTHGALLHNLGMIGALAADPPRVLAGWLPHHHDFGLVGLQLHALYAGADLLLAAPAAFVARPVRWLEMITRYRVGFTAAPDFGYAWCTRRITDGQLAGLDLSCLTMAVTGSEPIRARTIDAFTRRFAPVGFRPDAWVPCYGMAEATLMITGTRQGGGPTVRRFDAAALEHRRAEPAPGGIPLVASGRTVDLDLRIVDPDTGDVLPERRVGEIRVAGASVAAGYRGHPEATRHAFPAGVGSHTHLHTGDLGFLLDGDLYVTGRITDVIIVNGRSLHPHDLEETARQAHPAAGHGAAFAVTPPGGREHVVLVQELRRGHPPAEEIADGIVRAIGREFGISLSLVLVAPGGVQRTTSGKVRRSHMRKLFLDGLIAPLHLDSEPAVTDPTGGIGASPTPSPRTAEPAEPADEKTR